MTIDARRDLDALDLLLQGHREVESLIRDFECLRLNHGNTDPVIEHACMELGIHDALETGIFYTALRKAADDGKLTGLLDRADEEHHGIRELISELRNTPSGERDACFARLAGRVQQHVLDEEAKLFPQVRQLERLELGTVTAAMMKRSTGLIAAMEYPEPVEETA